MIDYYCFTFFAFSLFAAGHLSTIREPGTGKGVGGEYAEADDAHKSLFYKEISMRNPRLPVPVNLLNSHELQDGWVAEADQSDPEKRRKEPETKTEVEEDWPASLSEGWSNSK
jgi:hypothetical protein